MNEERNKYMAKKYGESKFHVFDGWYSVGDLEALLIEAKKLQKHFTEAQSESMKLALEESPD